MGTIHPLRPVHAERVLFVRVARILAVFTVLVVGLCDAFNHYLFYDFLLSGESCSVPKTHAIFVQCE